MVDSSVNYVVEFNAVHDLAINANKTGSGVCRASAPERAIRQQSSRCGAVVRLVGRRG
jgi:hypothetical protein